MKQSDYARLAENYSLQADAVQPGPGDALITKARQYQSYARMETGSLRKSYSGLQTE